MLVEKQLNNTSVIIADPKLGNQKRVNYDRLKKFNKYDYLKYKDVVDYDEDFKKYQKDLLNTLKNYGVKYRKKKIELDYTKRDSKKEKRERKKRERKGKKTQEKKRKGVK